ncbi:Ger(x)C family spore germination protein [Paenibacillus sp. CF384]|uniref:Ger(x)C family spore germination protein n=1 Tax=Paenibacillus sp. CF384 TaxID=1884382 RepID=UPI0008986F70|nr:Ger(x)C family spore germination protein [Paenibacillus sp. CF384]SDW19461.1 spore germination protein KC [Paenibacillus sp. CF384]
MNDAGRRCSSKWLLLPGCVIILLTLSGCWDRREVNDVAVILATGIDKNESGGIELSVQVFVPKKRSGGQENSRSGGGAPSTYVRSATGLTEADAFSKLREMFPRDAIWGHDKILIFSDKVAKEGIRDTVDVKMRFPDARMRLKIFISDGTAKSVLALQPPLEQSTASTLRAMTKLHSVMEVPIKSLAQMLAGKSGAAALPLVKILPSEQPSSPNQSTPFVKGTAVLKDGRMIGKIDDELTRSLLLLRNELRTSILTFAPKEGKGLVSLSLIRSHTTMRPRISDKKWSMTAQINLEARLVESTNAISYRNPQLAKQLEGELSEYVEGQIKNLFQRVQLELKSDIFEFAEIFYRKYPNEWERNKVNWEEKFPEVQVHVQVVSKIVSTGLVDAGVNRPENEVKKK